MKKILFILVTVVLTLALLSGCSAGGKEADEGDGRLRVVTTIFPEYDWVMNILGDNPGEVQVSMLLDNGVDLHSYQPTVDDILNISTCDVFVYVGGESDAWVESAMSGAVNKDMAAVNLLEVLGEQVKEEEMVEGMQKEDEGEEEEGYDEHVWLSLRNAVLLCDSICDALVLKDPAHGEIYKKNCAEYKEKLAALDEEYGKAVAEARFDTLLFGDRFPFRYMLDDYGLEYYAAFAGCSSESEAGFDTITFLAGKADELMLPAVLTIDGSDGKIAQTIVDNTKTGDKKVLVLDSMQSITSEDIKNGRTYLSVMRDDLAVLKEALN